MTLKQPIKYFLFFIGALLCFGLLAIATLTVRPLPLGFFLGGNSKLLERDGWRMEYSNLELSFAHGFVVAARNVQLKGPSSQIQTSLRKVDLKLETLPLLSGIVMANEITVDGLKLDMNLDEHGLAVAGVALRPSTSSQADAVDIISLLDNLHQKSATGPSFIAAIKKLSLVGSKVDFHDEIRAQDWSAQNIEITCDKPGPDQHDPGKMGHKLELSVSLTIARDSVQIPAKFHFVHVRGEATAAIDIEASAPNLQFLSGYAPQALAESIAAPVSAKVSTALLAGNTIDTAKIELSSGGGKVFLPSIFAAPLNFEKFSTRGTYDIKDSGSLRIEELAVADSAGLVLTAAGALTELTHSPAMNFQAGLTPTTIDHLSDYFPTIKAPALSNWLDKNLNRAHIRSAYLNISGPLADFPFAEDKPGSNFHAAFDFDGLEVRYVNNFPAGTDVNGRFEMDRGNIAINASAGKLGRQQVRNLSVSIKDVMQSRTPVLLTLEGEAAGETADAIAGFVRPFTSSSIPQFSGSQTSRVKLAVPLTGKKPGLTFAVSAKLSQLTCQDPAAGITFRSGLAELELNNNDTVFKGEGSINGIPANVVIQDKTLRFGDAIQVSLYTDTTIGILTTYLPPRYLSAAGPAKTNILLLKNGDEIAYQINADLADAAVNIPALKWSKLANTPGALQSKGRLSLSKWQVHVESLSINAPRLSIALNARLSLAELAASTIDVTQFRVGLTDLKFGFTSGKLSITGPHLDYNSLALVEANDNVEATDNNDNKAAGPNLDVSFQIGEIAISQGALFNARGKVNLQPEGMTVFSMDAELANKAAFKLSLGREGPAPTLKATGSDAGALMQLFFSKGDFRGGSFETHLTSGARNSFELNGGHGKIQIKDLQILKSPLLFKLLAKFSLESWLSPGKGVTFSEIGLSLSLHGRVLNIEELNMASPLLTLYFTGDVNLDSSALDLKGNAVPLRSVGKVTEMIPLLGDAASKAQKRFLGAPFTVKGTTASPNVSFLPF